MKVSEGAQFSRYFLISRHSLGEEDVISGFFALKSIAQDLIVAIVSNSDSIKLSKALVFSPCLLERLAFTTKKQNLFILEMIFYVPKRKSAHKKSLSNSKSCNIDFVSSWLLSFCAHPCNFLCSVTCVSKARH